MAKGRIISRSISTSRKVNRLTDRAALLYTWSIAYTDDYGKLEADPLTIRAKIVPMREYTLEQIEEDLKLIEKQELIKRYEVNGEKYLEIIGFEDHQTFRSDRPRRSEYPGPDGKYPSGTPVVYQRDTKDIPVGETCQRKLSQVKLSKVKLKNTLVREKKPKKASTEVEYSEAFEGVWKIYPRKISKGDAFKAWEKLNPNTALKIKIAARIEEYKKTKQWQTEEGRFIPHLSTFLNQRRFDDEPGETIETTGGGKYKGLGEKVSTE